MIQERDVTGRAPGWWDKIVVFSFVFEHECFVSFVLEDIVCERDTRMSLKQKTFVFEEQLTFFLCELRNLIEDGGRQG